MKIDNQEPFFQEKNKIFSHPWVVFNDKTYEVSFSSEAKEEFQKIIDTIQSQLKNDQDSDIISQLNEDTSITPEKIESTLDGMIQAWKWKKAIKKFIERVKDILWKNKKGLKVIENDKKIDKKVQKYTNLKRVEIIISCIDGDKQIILNDTPMTIWIWQDFATMLTSLNTRLRFKQLIHNKSKKNPH